MPPFLRLKQKSNALSRPMGTLSRKMGDAMVGAAIQNNDKGNRLRGSLRNPS